MFGFDGQRRRGLPEPANFLDDELSPAARMLTGADEHDADEHARRRACVVRAAERLVMPRQTAPSAPSAGNGRSQPD